MDEKPLVIHNTHVQTQVLQELKIILITKHEF